jgi:hypothetical protein
MAGNSLQDKVDFLLEDAQKVKTFKAEGESSTYVTYTSKCYITHYGDVERC